MASFALLIPSNLAADANDPFASTDPLGPIGVSSIVDPKAAADEFAVDTRTPDSGPLTDASSESDDPFAALDDPSSAKAKPRRGPSSVIRSIVDALGDDSRDPFAEPEDISPPSATTSATGSPAGADDDPFDLGDDDPFGELMDESDSRPADAPTEEASDEEVDPFADDF